MRPAGGQASRQAHRQGLECVIAGAFEGPAAEAALGTLLRVHLLELLPAGECQGGVGFVRLETAQGERARLIPLG